MTIAERISEYAGRLQFQELPPDVVHQTKCLVIDTLGCAFGGYDSDVSRIAREMAAVATAAQPATIFCSGQKTSVELAAFANDVMVRYLDYNDGYISKGGGHPSDSIPALIAVAETVKARGQELIVAVNLAYEVFCKLCDVWDNKTHGWDHATAGGIASATGVARLLGLSVEQTLHAINLTVAMNIALNQPRVGNVSQWKSCAYANANRNAIFAAQLAARGMTGGSHLFEGRDGFFRAVSREPFELPRFGGQGGSYSVMRCLIKQFPLGYFAQTVVTAALEARSTIDDVSNVAQIHIRTSKSAVYYMADNEEKWRPRNAETADHSMPYTAAVAMMYGGIKRSYFAMPYLDDAKLLDLTSKIKCSASNDADESENGINPCEFEVTMRSGERKIIRVQHYRGHWQDPMSRNDLEEKFRSQVGDMLPKQRIGDLISLLWKLDDLPDMRPIIELMQI